ncbi:hypothetical protein GYMLUDRAFT_246067 [Collybiopsis luxurians FD-317 M1]|uniref:Unplaced genomic scaffold GYMLUscaffold_37, whole genome shotgun sequence n=1 Tax=Collybiopsis luxurians FD-317 M1 TaxID=944289 RepID=A0A0D0C769_9AGAR|nr:hypothetical protein GYMLUDRAFT_246067 [Collybiopsis luxurians FD-317 M1]
MTSNSFQTIPFSTYNLGQEAAIIQCIRCNLLSPGPQRNLPVKVTDALSDDTESNQDLDLLGSTDSLDDNSESDEDAHLLEDSEEVDEKKLYMPVDRQTIVDVYPSQVPGFIYLQAPNMNPSNELLATYLWPVPGFKYRNCPRITSSQSDVVEGGCVTIWDRHHLELPIHHQIPNPATNPMMMHSAYPPGTWSSDLEPLQGESLVEIVPCIPKMKWMLKHINGTKDMWTNKHKTAAEI